WEDQRLMSQVPQNESGWESHPLRQKDPFLNLNDPSHRCAGPPHLPDPCWLHVTAPGNYDDLYAGSGHACDLDGLGFARCRVCLVKAPGGSHERRMRALEG